MLPRGARLRRNRDFQYVYRARKSWATPSLALHLRVGTPGPAGLRARVRIGFVISKKVAKRAHDRNRLKRRLREICRVFLLPRLDTGRPCDVIFVARSPAVALDSLQIAADVETLSRQARLF